MSSAFKTLFTDLINHNGDSSKLSKDLSKQMLKVFVKETSPYFLISDSYFYVPAYFTQAALDDFQKKFPTTSFSDLNEKVILITNWSLELKKVDSNSVFTSYGGIEVRLVVNGFKPQLGEAIHPVRWPTNLYRDDEFKTTIQHFRHRSIQANLEKLPATDVPLFSKGGVDQGIITGKDDWNFKEGTTKVVTLGGAKKAAAAASTSAAKVKGGAKRAGKAAAKSAKKVVKSAAVAHKVAKFTPSKAAPKATVVKGKKSATGGAKKALPTPVGAKKSAPATNDKMTLQSFKQFIKFQKGKKNTTLGKRSAGKKSNK
jgi:hypothetical protein